MSPPDSALPRPMPVVSRRSVLAGSAAAMIAAAIGLDLTAARPAFATGTRRQPLDSPFEYRDPFGMRKHPVTGQWKLHAGQDYGKRDGGSWSGASIRAIAAGVVVLNGTWDGGGNVLRIRHADNYTSTYMHMLARSTLSVGTQVTVGQVIGRVGNTGSWTTGPHLHLEVRTPTGAATNPLAYINAPSQPDPDPQPEPEPEPEFEESDMFLIKAMDPTQNPQSRWALVAPGFWYVTSEKTTADGLSLRAGENINVSWAEWDRAFAAAVSSGFVPATGQTSRTV